MISHPGSKHSMYSAQPVYCTYLPVNNPQAFNAGQQLRTTEDTVDDAEERMYNIPSDSDIIYASYANQLMAYTNRSIANLQNFCKPGFISCFGSDQCIAKAKWCDSSIDCLDASDESACSCKSRLSEDKICDGYLDCPMGSDEMGCFGCDKFSYSCYKTQEEFEAAKESSFLMCYTNMDKCDGTENCLNGRDEQDCSMIVRTIGQHLVSFCIFFYCVFVNEFYLTVIYGIV